MSTIAMLRVTLSHHRVQSAVILAAIVVSGVLVSTAWSNRATSLSANLPASQGQLTGPASLVDDLEAASGQAVQFQAPTTSEVGFTHPGIMVDKSQLDFVKNQLTNGAATWTAGKAKIYSRFLNASYVPAPVATIDCTANSTGCSKLMDDSIAAYTQALLYSYSTDADRGKYAKSAINIMNAWSNKLRNYNGNQARLQLAWSGEVFPRAAEIIRYSYTPPAGDPAFDIAGFSTMLNNVHRPAIVAGDGASNGNWELSMADALISIGVFNDDRATFDIGTAMWRGRVPAYIYMASDDNASGLPNRPPGDHRYDDPAYLKCYWLGGMSYTTNCNVPGFAYTQGMTQETCRDLSHASMGLLAATNAAETARLQGLDLYGEQRERITTAYEFHGAFINAYLTTGSYPALPCGGKPGQVWSPSADGTGGTGYKYGWEVAYNHYASRLGQAMPNSKVMVTNFRPIGAANAANWETLTHAGHDLPPNCAQPDARFGTTTMTVDVPADGTYRLWTRLKPATAEPAAWALQVDNGCPLNFSGAGNVAGAWTWLDYLNGDPTAKANVTLTAGQHTIILTGRTPGLAIDSVALKEDLTCVPINANANCRPPDTTPPSITLTSPVVDDILVSAVNLTADASDDTAVTQVEFLANGEVVGTSTTVPFQVTWDVSALPNGTYSIQTRAQDAAGNTAITDPVLVLVNNPASDAPNPPSGLSASEIQADTVTFSWSAASGTHEIAHYKVYRNGTSLGTTTETTYTDTDLADGTTYAYTVRAVDVNDNQSSNSETLTVTTLDTTAPAAPTSLSAGPPTETGVQLSWQAVTDNVGVTAYEILRDGNLLAIVDGSALSYQDSALTIGQTYSYTIRARDLAGNTSAESPPLTITTTDGTAPAAPGNLTVTASDETTVNLTWAAATDNVGVTGYQVFRGDTLVGTTTDTSYSDSGRSASINYSYTVVALDAAGNASAASAPASVTMPDSTAPSAPEGLSVNGQTETSLTLSWTTASDNVAVVRYVIFRNGSQVGTTSSLSYTDTGLTPATAYTYTIHAEDQAGNRSAASDTLSTTTPDATAPTAPAGLTASAPTETTVSLNWQAATDNVGVANYRILRAGTQIGTTTGTNYIDSGRIAATTYSYTIVAVDAAGNVSANSATASVTTPDQTAPSAPGTLTAVIAAASQVKLTWTTATDNVGVASYRLLRGSTQLTQANVLTFTDSNLSPNTAYNYSVVALDAAGNVSTSKTASITTPTDAAPYGAGWAGSYFNNTSLSGPAIGRLDPTVDFSWGSNTPMAGINTDNFSVRWTGQLKPTATGSYTFYTTADDGVRLWLNGQLIIDRWNNSGSGTSSARTLTANTVYNLKLEYQEKTGSANAKLQWSGPSIAKTTIPSSVMTSGSAGLTASYFANANLTGNPALVRQDSTVNYTWSGAPDALVPADNFSVRWTGKVKSAIAGTYTFYTDSDDGVRLWVNGQQLVNNWTDHGVTTNSGTITLAANTLYDIKMEYYDRTNSATAKLSWSYTGLVKTIIPNTALRDR